MPNRRRLRIGPVGFRGILLGASLALAVVIQNAVFAPSAYALVPPPDCFVVDAATGTILAYGNDITDPANPNEPWARSIGTCPTDVDIPSVVEGVAIKAVGISAFHGEGLTTISLPSSLLTIEASAFSDNQLTAVNIPGSITTIGADAFANNRITSLSLHEGTQTIGLRAFEYNDIRSVVVPNSLTSLVEYPTTTSNTGDTPIYSYSIFGLQGRAAWDLYANVSMSGGYLRLYESDSSDPYVLSAINSTWAVAVYTADPTNPRGFRDYVDIGSVVRLDAGLPVVGNFTIGGHLINPVSVSVTHQGSTGDTLLPSTTYTGQLANGTYLNDYVIGASGIAIPVPANTRSPTPQEQQAISQALAPYWRLGSTQTFTAPAVEGYDTVTPTSPHRMVLGATTNALTFVYSNAGAVNTSGSLSNTGVNIVAIGAIAFGLLASAAAVLSRQLLRKRRILNFS